MKSDNFGVIFDVLMIAALLALLCCQLRLEIKVTGVVCIFCSAGKNFSYLVAVPRALFRAAELEELEFGLLFAKQIRKTDDDTCEWSLPS